MNSIDPIITNYLRKSVIISIMFGGFFLYAQNNAYPAFENPWYQSLQHRTPTKSQDNFLDKWIKRQHSPRHLERRPSPYHTPHNPVDEREGEFIIDTNIVYGTSLTYEENPSIIFTGTNYLLLWPEWDYYTGFYTVKCSRITPQGVLIDTARIRITENMEYGAEYPAIASDGVNSLIVFQTRDSNWESDIYGIRIDANGTVLDTLGIPISTAPYDQYDPCVAYDGSNYLVAWMDDRDGDYYFDLYCARVSPSGTVLDPAGILVFTSGYNSKPSIAFDGANYLIVWDWSIYDTLSCEFAIYGSRVSPSGTVLDPTGIEISACNFDTLGPRIVFGGVNYFVVYQNEDTMDYNHSIIGIRVTPAGSVIDTTGIIIWEGSYDDISTAVSFDGANYLILWQSFDSTYYANNIMGARLNQSGVVLDSSGIVVSGNIYDQITPALAYGTDKYLAVWCDYRNQFIPDIYGTGINPSGTVLDTLGINYSIAGNAQYFSAASFDGANYLVAWDDNRGSDGYPDIYGVRVSTSGAVIDPVSFAVSIAPDYQIYPAGAFDGANHMVVWEDQRNSYQPDIYGARVSPSGTVLDPAGISIADGNNWQEWPAVAHGTTNYFVTWTEVNDYTYEYDIYGARVTPGGSVLDPNGIRLSFSGLAVDISAVAFDGTNFFVAWTVMDTINYYYDIYGTRVTQSGTVLDPAGIAICTADADQSWPSISFDGINYLVTWHDWRSGMFSMIYGARVSTTGVVLDPSGIAISADTMNSYMPRAAFDGSNHVITWMGYGFNGDGANLYGAKVNPAGTVISRFPVVTQSQDQMYPCFAKGQGNQLLLTYCGWTDNINGRPADTYRIWGKMYPFPGVEENGNAADRKPACHLDIQPNPARNRVRMTLAYEGVAPSANSKDLSVLSLKVYDVSGRLVRDLSSEIISLAPTVDWNGDDESGRKLPTGIYFVKLSAGKNVTVKKIVLTR